MIFDGYSVDGNCQVEIYIQCIIPKDLSNQEKMQL